MKLDIYKRSENGGGFSYLAVPEGKVLPDEVTNIDWERTAQGFEFNEDEDALSDYAITRPVEQITAKGYAITSVHDIARTAENH